MEKYNEDVLMKYQADLLPLFCLIHLHYELPSLSAYIGGIASQEVLKAITKKYTPISQVYICNREDVLPFKYSEFDFLFINKVNNVETDQLKFD